MSLRSSDKRLAKEWKLSLISDKEFLWHYYHKSDNSQEIYHWHRLAGKTPEQITENGFEWLLPMWDHFMYKYNFKEKYGLLDPSNRLRH